MEANAFKEKIARIQKKQAAEQAQGAGNNKVIAEPEYQAEPKKNITKKNKPSAPKMVKKIKAITQKTDQEKQKNRINFITNFLIMAFSTLVLMCLVKLFTIWFLR